MQAALQQDSRNSPSRWCGCSDHVENVADEGFYGAYGGFRDNAAGAQYGSTYDSPGWRRAQARKAEAQGFAEGYSAFRRGPIIDAKARVVSTNDPSAAFNSGERVFHQKFGYGRIVAIEGNKLLVDFEKAGSKRVMDGFVSGPSPPSP